jgi:glycosyltransferase involved in cell wall biosynthesis
MATYNGEKYLKQQIDSILSQIGNDDELIISDDGSTDGTIDLINKINDNRIEIYIHTPSFPKKKKMLNLHTANHYISFNFLNAIEKASGDFIFLSDQDDIWYPYKIEKSMEALKYCDMVISNFSVVDQDGQVIIKKYQKKKPFSENYFLSALSPGYTGCAMAFKREILNYVLPFPKDVSCGHDNWAGVCVTRFGKIFYIDEPLFQHRIHDNNNSGLAKKSPNNIAQKINLRICLLFNILARHK